MRIGILTFLNAYNYGAILQAYATQTFLEELGHTPELIDYRNARIERAYQSYHFGFRKLSIRKPLYSAWTLIRPVFQQKKERRFDRFKKNCLHISDNTFFQGMEVDARRYDRILVGSDQIWNPKLTDGFDKVYFGDVAKRPEAKVISWSPGSIYTDYSEEERRQLASLLGHLSHISVREERLRQIVSALTDKPITVTLDPVFMIGPEHWERFCHEVDKKDYVLLYAVRHKQQTLALAKRIARKLNKKLLIIQSDVNPAFRVGVYLTSSPEDFLSLLYHADFVVTSSMHGAAFSILFKKKFVNFVPESAPDARMHTLLSSLGLEARAADESYDIAGITDEIDYASVYRRLSVLRQESEDYLTGSLS